MTEARVTEFEVEVISDTPVVVLATEFLIEILATEMVLPNIQTTVCVIT